MLAGKVNPSGRLTDTIAYQVEDHPSSANFGNYRYPGTLKTYIEYQETSMSATAILKPLRRKKCSIHLDMAFPTRISAGTSTRSPQMEKR